MNHDDNGRFPFGRPNSHRPPRLAARSDAFVVGVYPSAFHISWTPPERFDTRSPAQKRFPYVAALAVDVEPTVFWDGKKPNPTDEFNRWARAVGFTAEMGTAQASGSNGPSGAGLVERYLAPLGLAPEHVSFTDAVPTFYVKYGPKSQGDAILQRFAPIAKELGVHPGSLPERPTPARLVRDAVETQRDRLRDELTGAAAPLVITLGQEAADVIRRIVDRADGAQARLAADGYGRVGEVQIGSYTAEWIPFAHPGLIRQGGAWSATHTLWQDAQQADT